MPRYKLTIEYDGAPFAGWQLQPDRPTVQGAVEAAVKATCGEDVRVRGRLLSIRNVQLTPVEGGRVNATVQAAAYMGAPASAAPATPAGGEQPAPQESTAAAQPPTQPAMIGAGG